MTDASSMSDLAFDIKGGSLPAGYMFALWREVLRVLPWLEGEPNAGILPLRVVACEEQMLLPQRAKLVLRLPTHSIEPAKSLAGQQLDISGAGLAVGEAKLRPLQAHSSLHAQLVASAADEQQFLDEVASGLRALGVSCRWICGKHVALKGERQIAGYSLVLHELKPQDSLLVQSVGLGGERRYGCGIFIPYKNIPHLD